MAHVPNDRRAQKQNRETVMRTIREGSSDPSSWAVHVEADPKVSQVNWFLSEAVRNIPSYQAYISIGPENYYGIAGFSSLSGQSPRDCGPIPDRSGRSRSQMGAKA